MPHLTEVDITEYRRRKLPPAAMLAIDDHIAACQDCRRLVRESEPMAESAAVLAQLGEPHLTYESIEAYVEDRAARDEQRRIHSHLELCPQCRQEVADLREFRNSLRPPRPRRLPRWLAAAAAILLAINTAWWWTHRPPEILRRTLATGELYVPDQILALRGTRSVVRAPGPVPVFTLLSPIATAVLTGRPALDWQKLTGATGYRVAIFAPGFHKVAESEWLELPGWTPSEPLARGQVYSWQVTARLGAGEDAPTVRAPGLTDPEAKFQVIGGEEAAELERAAREHPSSHLLLGVLYARAGILDLAEQEFAANASDHPQSALAAALLKKVRALRQ